MPKVSIITPVYNRPYFLEEAVESIRQQTFTDWEHIIIDDGSSDPETRRVLEKLQSHPQVSIHSITNRGLADARNFGIQKSSGEYILTLDDDDKWHSSFIDAALDVFQNKPNTGAVTSWIQEFGLSKRIIRIDGGDVKNFLIENNSTHGLFKRKYWEELQGYDEKMKTGYEDWDFWLRLTAMGHPIESIANPFFFYRIHQHASLYNDAKQKHLELFRYIVEKNKEIYSKYLVDGLCLLEKKVLDRQLIADNNGLLGRLRNRWNKKRNKR